MKIIVLTPIKNEDWILDRFLSVTSQFADIIIIADQNSTDNSKNIYPKYPKVHVIENNSTTYDEAERQILLINKARELEPGPKILLALDADELLAANALQTIEWQTIKKASKGTVLCFEKPDLIHSPDKCMRWRSTPWPLGYVDDGIEHKPSKVHSIRIPNPPNHPILILNEIKIIHYAYVRMSSQNAKLRYYSVVENNLNSLDFIKRRYRYTTNKQWQTGLIEDSQKEWFEGWEKMGIDMTSVSASKYYWQDIEVLANFKKYGSKKYWLDDIWDQNWQEVKNISVYKDLKIVYPPKYYKIILKVIDNLFKFYKKISLK